MARTLDFIQIYYSDWQLPYLYGFSKPYKNTELSPYFENKVICDIVPLLENDYISVCSWRLQKKRGDGPTPIILKGKTELTKEKITSTDFDIAVLTPRSAGHQVLYLASKWHGESWDRAIKLLGKEFIKVPENPRAIYENHFIATRDIYHEYVSECLKPCIDYMDMNKDVFFASADYLKRKRDEEERENARRNLLKIGLDDYPIAPFVLERLFSFWIEGKGFKIVNL